MEKKVEWDQGIECVELKGGGKGKEWAAVWYRMGRISFTKKWDLRKDLKEITKATQLSQYLHNKKSKKRQN